MSDASQTLERLLDLKRRITEDHRVALSRKQAALQESEERLTRLSRELEQLQEELRDLLRKARVISPTQMLLGDQVRQSQLEMIEVQKEEVREAEEELARARDALQRARQDERVVELLRERELHRHLVRRRRTEIQHIDELSALRHQRNKSRFD